MTKQLRVLFLLLLVGFFAAGEASAQANLSFQGILKKANGLAVDDGNYDLTFTLYDVETGGTAANVKHEETISDVEVAGGIYSVILGAQAGDPLNAAFDVPYFLGIKVGGSSATEMVPRIRLTSAPYALALRGSSNVFPGSGTVLADKIEVNGGVLAEGGGPGGSGANNNGYAFKDNGGDTDSGMFSNADGEVSLYANNSERIRVANTVSDNRTYLKSNVTIDNSLTIADQLLVSGNVGSDLKFANQKGLQYNGMNDWRLVHRDDFGSGGVNSWFGTSALNNTTSATLENVDYGAFNGRVIRPQANSHWMKKEFDLSGVGAYTYVKVVFKYYFTDSWDPEEIGLAGFSPGNVPDANHVICWQQMSRVYANSSPLATYTGSGYSDGATMGQMIAYYPSSTSSLFHVFFDMKSSESTANERYAISDIEIWVR
jgi:hypothetical protein